MVRLLSNVFEPPARDAKETLVLVFFDNHKKFNKEINVVCVSDVAVKAHLPKL